MTAVKQTIGIARSANGNPKWLAPSQQKRSTMEVTHPNNTPTKNVRQRLGGESKKENRKTTIAPIIRMAAKANTWPCQYGMNTVPFLAATAERLKGTHNAQVIASYVMVNATGTSSQFSLERIIGRWTLSCSIFYAHLLRGGIRR